jgi:hypothetical protein
VSGLIRVNVHDVRERHVATPRVKRKRDKCDYEIKKVVGSVTRREEKRRKKSKRRLYSMVAFSRNFFRLCPGCFASMRMTCENDTSRRRCAADAPADCACARATGGAMIFSDSLSFSFSTTDLISFFRWIAEKPVPSTSVTDTHARSAFCLPIKGTSKIRGFSLSRTIPVGSTGFRVTCLFS